MKKNTNTTWHNTSVTRERREALNNHKSVILWFTGLSGSGKSTLAHAVEEKLYQQGCRTHVLDGDNVRHGLCSDLTFSNSDRRENIRRIGELAKLMLESGTITLTAFISPFISEREMARKLVPHGEFIEIYCKSSLEVCESRDVKGLYQKARDGLIKDFTGISSPYEEPKNPELVVNTGSDNLAESTHQVLKLLENRGLIPQTLDFIPFPQAV
ncbi:MAG: adenylyl-sulfate kinase [Gammaproteobacteria bacterium]|nr:adenylyl-sulfate kinase [Gammaproteobacteria bacterium]